MSKRFRLTKRLLYIFSTVTYMKFIYLTLTIPEAKRILIPPLHLYNDIPTGRLQLKYL
jgi:hypothetical protein